MTTSPPSSTFIVVAPVGGSLSARVVVVAAVVGAGETLAPASASAPTSFAAVPAATPPDTSVVSPARGCSGPRFTPNGARDADRGVVVVVVVVVVVAVASAPPPSPPSRRIFSSSAAIFAASSAASLSASALFPIPFLWERFTLGARSVPGFAAAAAEEEPLPPTPFGWPPVGPCHSVTPTGPRGAARIPPAAVFACKIATSRLWLSADPNLWGGRGFRTSGSSRRTSCPSGVVTRHLGSPTSVGSPNTEI